MVRQELGDTIDIHLGGADLVFPHHENEIAQSEAATGQPLARIWLHNGMVNVDGEKMSKSLGNFTTIRALLASGVSPMTLRLFVLQAHYRKPLDFTAEALDAAATGWQGLNAALGLIAGSGSAPSTHAAITPQPQGEPPLPAALSTARERFIAAMDDDLNTAAATAVLFELARPLRALANRIERGDGAAAEQRQTPAMARRAALLQELAGVLGLKGEANAPAARAAAAAEGFSETEINALIDQRCAAKAAKDFANADQIRARLLAAGIELIDKPGGLTDWLRR